MPSHKKIIIALLIAALGVLLFLCWWGIVGKAEIDADRIAAFETRMWKAYYSGDKKRLALELTGLQARTFGLSRLEAARVTHHLAKATMAFRESNSNHERDVLPDLIQAYTRVKSATGAVFDPEKAARAELAWWVARRNPKEDSPQQVGARIAALYAELYGGMRSEFEQAGLLRAEAAALRDQGRKNADWPHIEQILRKSYGVLVPATHRKN